MKRNIKYIVLLLFIAGGMVIACKKTDYSFGQIKTPTNVTVTAAVQGQDAADPAGDGSGNVTITVTATDALGYKIYYGDGDSAYSNTGSFTYKYTTLDTNTYTITVNAVGTGGAMSTSNLQVKVLYLFQIPADIMTGLTNNASQNWVIQDDKAGHFGVGPNTTFTPDWYTAQPYEKPMCAYDDVITFTQTGPNSVSMNVNNMGESFLIGAAVGFYGASGSGDGCYAISTGGTKNLAFKGATSGSTSANSTQVQFTVPGNGIIDFGTGGSSYEIISLSNGVMILRNIGIDGNAWYQTFKLKP